MHFDFTERTIVITGATRGIGKQIADDLFCLGANLILTGTDSMQIEKLNQLDLKGPGKKNYLVLDLLEVNSITSFIKKIKKLERIDGLVNNAGINRLNHVQNVEINDWNDMIQVNLTAPFKLIQAVSEKMIINNYGRIINIGSIFSKISKEKRVVYSSTKFGLNGLTVGSSNDLARFNIMVNTLSPGFVMTDLTRTNLSNDEILELAKQIPTKRMANVKDISNVAIFLLSEHNNYLTGQNIIVDGGFTNT